MPIFALAPGRLSTITGCFNVSASDCPTVLATMSTAPPAAYGTMILIGRFGYDCACAVNGAIRTVDNSSARSAFPIDAAQFLDMSSSSGYCLTEPEAVRDSTGTERSGSSCPIGDIVTLHA